MENLVLAKVIQRVMPMACFACLVYMLILLMEIVGFYKMEANHPLLMISYPTILHLFALPLLALSLFGFHRFLFLYLCLNGFWVVAIIVIVILFYALFPTKITEQWKNDPCHHMLLACYFLTSIALQIMVHLLSMQCRELERRVQLKKEQLEREKKHRKLSSRSSKSPKSDASAGKDPNDITHNNDTTDNKDNKAEQNEHQAIDEPNHEPNREEV